MRSDEISQSSGLLGTALDEVTVLVRDVHRALSQRAFGLLGKAALPVRVIHDPVATIAYTATRAGVRYLPPAVGLAAAARHAPDAPSVHDHPHGRVVLGAISGFWGDRLAEHRPAVAPAMRLRAQEGPLHADPRDLVRAVGEQAIGKQATGRIVVFIHGLCETDQAWRLGATRTWGSSEVNYGSRLRDEDGRTPLYLMFNSGRHISDNGFDLAQLLQRTVDCWPVPVVDIALVGHSMGGLIARSAAHQAKEHDLSWVAKLSHIVGLGAPHTGAPLERAVAHGTARLARLPETQPLATWLNRRSIGIKDLRHGAIVAADWSELDYDLCNDDRCTDVAFLPGVAYSMASATLSRRPTGRLAHDLLVAHTSANGVGKYRKIAFDPERALHIGGGRHHFDLLNNADIYAALRRWLNEPAPDERAVVALA